MFKTWVLAAGAFAAGAFTLVRSWRRRQAEALQVFKPDQTVSSEWLSSARGRTDESW